MNSIKRISNTGSSLNKERQFNQKNKKKDSKVLEHKNDATYEEITNRPNKKG